MRLREPIDASKYDIRVLCTGPADSPDAGYVEGAPIDPPDESSGWLLVDLWVEHDTVQEKSEKGSLVTRKQNPAYYQLWARLKDEAPKKRKPKASASSTEGATPPKKRGRPKKDKPSEAPETAPQTTLPNVADAE